MIELPSGKRGSWLRTAGFYLAAAAVCYVTIEIGAFLYYSVDHHGWFSFAEIEREANEAKQITHSNSKRQYSVAGGIGSRVLHPYVGFVFEPGTELTNIAVSPRRPFTFHECSVNDHGFTGEPAFLKKSNETVNIVLVGGSVANQLYCSSRQILLDELSKERAFRGKQLRMVSLAIGAHKQPQQLMAVNYYLAHGGEFDILVNLDGFNEAHNTASMAEVRVFPSYPYRWEQTIADLDPQSLKIVGKIGLMQDARGKLLDIRRKLSRSIFVNVAWAYLDRLLTLRMNASQAKLETHMRQIKEFAFHRNGPSTSVNDIDSFTVDIWFRASQQLSRIARANSAAYFHFLQPNIHLEGSKPLSSEERSLIETLPPNFYPDRVQLLYEGFAKRVPALKSENVIFYDLSQLFVNEMRTVYVDPCCHYNLAGNSVLAKKIADLLKLHFSAKKIGE